MVFISPDHKGPRLFLAGYVAGGENRLTSPDPELGTSFSKIHPDLNDKIRVECIHFETL